MATTVATTAATAAPDYNLITAGTLTVGTNAQFPPFDYIEGGQVVGVDAAMMEKVAEKLGLTLDIKDMDLGTLPDILQSGQIDVIAAAPFTMNADRQATADFSDSYYTAQQAVLVKTGSAVASLDDLKNLKIGVQTDTAGQNDAAANVGSPDSVISFASGAMAVDALIGGQVDAVILDSSLAQKYQNENGGTLKLVDNLFAPENYTVAVKKGNTDLLNAINTAIAQLKINGTLQSILDQYIQ